MSDNLIVNYVVQFGSFGVIVVLIIWFLKFGIPEALGAYKTQGDEFARSLERLTTANANALEKIELRHEKNQERIACAVDKLIDRIDDKAGNVTKVAG